MLFSGGKFTPLSYDSDVYDDSTGTDDGRIYFGGETGMWGKSVLREISKSDKNLAVNFSASLYNNIHSHKGSTFKKQDVKAFEKASLLCRTAGARRTQAHIPIWRQNMRA